MHRSMFTKLCEHRKQHPKDIKVVNGVRFCCQPEFRIGTGNDGTRVYIGLGQDGCEKAVKRLPRDTCARLAEQEKNILNETSARKSNYVLNYWFLDDKSDKDYLYLILDLCEENLENFIRRTELDELIEKTPSIIKQILTGLADLHGNSQPILHRDIKPHNLLRDVNGNWLLADFGLSRLLTGNVNTLPSKERGTDDWRAVESYPQKGLNDDEVVCYRTQSDIQVRFCQRSYPT